MAEVRYPVEPLTRFTSDLLAAAGLEGEKAQTVARLLVLTDGRNVFDEQRVDERRLGDLSVLVIGNERGCAEVPTALWNRCFVTRATADDVAAQLARIFQD